MIANVEKDMPITESQNADNLDKITKPSKRGQQKRVDDDQSMSDETSQNNDNQDEDGDENIEAEASATEESKTEVSTSNKKE